MSYVRALYDFSGEPSTSEISIAIGEVLCVTRTDVGEGWWEGKNSRGQVGLFPAAYVEVLSAIEVAQLQANGGGDNRKASSPPEPAAVAAAAAAVGDTTAGARYDQTADDWNDDKDDWEDDWDEDNDTYSEIGQGSATNNNARYDNRYPTKNLPPTPSDDAISYTSTATSSAGATNTATLKKSGMFAKSGDSYIMGQTTAPVSDHEKVYIVQHDTYFTWAPITDPYTVRVASPKKETKFKGMKSFIAYQLTPNFNNIAVSRRYKHFDWLHERLVEKFCVIAIPPLPDKQISGRYEESFIEHRRSQLQEFVDWMCRHPVLSRCEVWRHFLTCTDEKLWKQGKRSAERDLLVGITYCATIFPPEKNLMLSFVDQQMEGFATFVHQMDAAVKALFAISTEQIKRNQLQAKKDFQRIGDGLSELAKALKIDEQRVTTAEHLSDVVGKIAGVFILLGQKFAEQPKYDWLPFSDRLHIYRGVLSNFPDILSTHKSAIQKRKDCQRLVADQRMGNAQMAEVNRRVDIISYAVLAEMSHFREERDHHLRQTVRNLIDAQIQFYRRVIDQLELAKNHFA